MARRASADSGGAPLPDENAAVLPLRLPLLPVDDVDGYMTLRMGKYRAEDPARSGAVTRLPADESADETEKRPEGDVTSGEGNAAESEPGLRGGKAMNDGRECAAKGGRLRGDAPAAAAGLVGFALPPCGAVDMARANGNVREYESPWSGCACWRLPLEPARVRPDAGRGDSTSAVSASGDLAEFSRDFWPSCSPADEPALDAMLSSFVCKVVCSWRCSIRNSARGGEGVRRRGSGSRSCRALRFPPRSAGHESSAESVREPRVERSSPCSSCSRA